MYSAYPAEFGHYQEIYLLSRSDSAFFFRTMGPRAAEIFRKKKT